MGVNAVNDNVRAQSCPTLCNCSPPGSSVHGEFSRQEHWSGLPLHTPGDLPNPGIELASPMSAGGFFTSLPRGKPINNNNNC